MAEIIDTPLTRMKKKHDAEIARKDEEIAALAAYFETIDGLVTSFLGDIVMALSVLALWYHALGGVRHLIWDTGRALDVASADRLGWAMIIGSVVLTALTLIAI